MLIGVLDITTEPHIEQLKIGSTMAKNGAIKRQGNGSPTNFGQNLLELKGRVVNLALSTKSQLRSLRMSLRKTKKQKKLDALANEFQALRNLSDFDGKWPEAAELECSSYGQLAQLTESAGEAEPYPKEVLAAHFKL